MHSSRRTGASEERPFVLFSTPFSSFSFALSISSIRLKARKRRKTGGTRRGRRNENSKEYENPSLNSKDTPSLVSRGEVCAEGEREARNGVALSDNPFVQPSCMNPIVCRAFVLCTFAECNVRAHIRENPRIHSLVRCDNIYTSFPIFGCNTCSAHIHTHTFGFVCKPCCCKPPVKERAALSY